MASLRSKLDRAIVAYLKTVSGVTANIFPSNYSGERSLPLTDVNSSQGPEDPMFTGNHIMSTRIRIECQAANQPGQTNPNRNRAVLDGYVDKTFDAFHIVAAGDQDYRETARLITVAGRLLASTGTAQEQAGNVDMLDFTCQYLQGIIYVGGAPEEESNSFIEIMTLQCRCCAANVEV